MANLYVLSIDAGGAILTPMSFETKSLVETGPFCEWPAKPRIGHLSVEEILEKKKADALYELLARRFGFTQETLFKEQLVNGILRPFLLTEVQALHLALLYLEGHPRNKALIDLSLSIEESGGRSYELDNLSAVASQSFSGDARQTMKKNMYVKKRNEIYFSDTSSNASNQKTESELQALENICGIPRWKIFKFEEKKYGRYGYITKDSTGIYNLHTAIHAMYLRFATGLSYKVIAERVHSMPGCISRTFSMCLSEEARDILKKIGKMQDQKKREKKK